MNQIKIALVQMNSWVGDLEGNAKKIIDGIFQAKSSGAHIVVFPELAITGYPPEDLLFKKKFIDSNLILLQKVISSASEITAILGFVDKGASLDKDAIYNAAAIIHDGRLVGTQHKFFLPNYGVFDEARYFAVGESCEVFEMGNVTFGVGICEDIWYSNGPALYQTLLGGANLIININASPFHAGKWKERENLLLNRARDYTAFIVYLNMVGGQDELVFDGHSLVVHPEKGVIARGTVCQEGCMLVDLIFEAQEELLHESGKKLLQKDIKIKKISLSPLSLNHIPISLNDTNSSVISTKSKISPPEECEEIYKVLVLGVRDYVDKNGFKEVVIGLSGGIDSALTLAITVDALGKEKVKGIFLPSRYSSSESGEDVRKLAANLGILCMEISIEEIFSAYLNTLESMFKGKPIDVTEENIQARIRGNILMALSNKFGWLVLTTGNKSEMACGYATLYGDMAGGFAVIKDVPKTLVYKLAYYRNSINEVIPHRILEKAPTAELRHGQKDQDTLPPYEILDLILKCYVEEDRPLEEIAAMGFDEATARSVIAMVDKNEYKRRQAPPGIKITPKAFGKDRRLPITNHYQEWKK